MGKFHFKVYKQAWKYAKSYCSYALIRIKKEKIYALQDSFT